MIKAKHAGDKPLQHSVDEILAQETGSIALAAPYAQLFAIIAASWSLFQLWIASPLPFIVGFGIVDGVEARGVHLAFALLLGFLAFGLGRRAVLHRPSPLDISLALAGSSAAFYLLFNHADIAARAGQMLRLELGGITIPIEALIGWTGILVLLEATRRIIGLPLVILCLVFIGYSLFGQVMPDIIAHKGLSIERFAGTFWLGQEAIFGIPIDVSARFIFLFVLFGALLDAAGAGQYFIDLAFGVVGRYRGGPAKSAVLSSGLSGMISGSSVANVVTTGTFTIPVMKKAGVPAVKAGAIEVAASVDGQIMPPIMGAAAFVMAEFIGISYFDVIKHAFLPAVISYIALFYIVDIEAQKLGLKPMAKEDVPSVRATFWRGAHYLLPIILLIYLLIVERLTTATAVFWSTLSLMLLILVQEVLRQRNLRGLRSGVVVILTGLVNGARNMIGVAVAVAAAGIIVGAVASTGLSNALSGIIEQLAGGNIYALLGLIAVLTLVLGLGLPTTANYLVVASLMAPVMIEVGAAAGLELPLIAAHMFVFYFGLMADVTPPVGLAAYAAAGISRADPIETGVQAFFYSIRTAILPFIFIFNLNMLMIGIDNWLHAFATIIASTLALLVFVNITQRWMFTRLTLIEMGTLALVMAMLFRPGFFMERINPSWQPIGGAMLTGKPIDADIRLHLVRETAYGDRRRIALFTHDTGPANWQSLGLSVTADSGASDQPLTIADVTFMGRAEQAGIAPGDRIVYIETPNPDGGRLRKEWMFVPALVMLVLVAVGNRRRARRSSELAVS